MAWTVTWNKSVANTAAAFTEIDTQLVAAGWTVHDDQFAGSSYKVYKSNGESGTKEYAYVKMTIVSNTIQHDMYQYWSTTAHTGYNRTYPATAYVLTCSASPFTLWFYGNKDEVLLASYVSSTYDYLLFGHIANVVAPTTKTTVTVDTINDTTGQQITVSDTSGFSAGDYVCMYGLKTDASWAEESDIVVKTIDSGTLMTVDGLGTLFDANNAYVAKLGMTGFSTDCGSSGYIYYQQYFPGTSASNSSTAWSATGFLPNTIGDPDKVDRKWILSPVSFIHTGSSGNESYLGYSSDNLCSVPFATGQWVSNDTMTVDQSDSGTATSATGTTLVDSGKSWTVDALIGDVVVITGGTGAGQIRKITDNDATSITVATWTTTPSTDSTYVICDKAFRLFARTTTAHLAFAVREGV